MSRRAVSLGLLLGLFVASTTYFNDHVIRQTMVIGNHLPAVVFGLIAAVQFLINPLLRRRTRSGPISTGEMAVMVAITLAACGWPGNSFYRGFASVVSLPAHWVKTQTPWLSADVMSFVPGGSGDLADEHLPDAPGFARLLLSASESPEPSLAGRIWRHLDERGRTEARQLATLQTAEPRDRARFTAAINRVLADPALYDPKALAAVDLSEDLRDNLVAARSTPLDRFEQTRMNRQLLAEAMPQWVLPAPRGEGVLLEGGKAETKTQQLLRSGPADADQWLGVSELPWRAWWRTLALWGGVAIALGVASLCLALIVHPQWSHRELLPYPIPRFLRELTTTEPGRQLPAVARQRGFWVAFACILAVHLLNGLHAYFPSLPSIPLRLDLNGLRELFPSASRVFGSGAYFGPRIYPAAIAFALFLSSSVSFSLGIAHFLLMLLGGLLIARGVGFERDYLGGSQMNMMSFGSYVAAMFMILYVGRRYYANVAAAMVGLPRHAGTPTYAPRAGWILVAALTVAVALLYGGGLPVPLGVGMVLLIMLIWLVMSRISAETGLFLIKTGWLPVGVMTALLGFEAVGPTGYIVLAVATVVLVGEVRDAIMPFLVNGLRIADHADKPVLAGTARWMGVMMVLSLLVAGAASLTLQHNLGLDERDPFVTHLLSRLPFDELSQHIATARAEQSLDASVSATGLERLTLIRSEPGSYAWAGFGCALVLVTAAARLRLPWWPLHPVIFLVWGTWPMFLLSFSFFLGWLIKLAIVRTSGTRGYHAVIPIAVGVILGEIVAALGWSLVGAGYFFRTGLTPPAYHVFPY